MNAQYIKLATRIIGELEVRYNWVSAKNNPKEVVVNLWANELQKIVPQALTPEVIRKAIEEWEIDHDDKPPLAGQFVKILRRLTNDLEHRQAKHKMLEEESKGKQIIDWIGMFDRCDNRGKFKFFFLNQDAPSVCRHYAKEWYLENTKFSEDNIHEIINGKLPQ